MTNNTTYTDAPAEVERALKNAVPTEDFLPSPAELIRKTEKERITIAIDKHNLDLFRQYAKKHNAKYQTMINDILSIYAEKFLHDR